MQRESSHHRTSLRATPVAPDATAQVPLHARAMQEALMALEHGEVEEDCLTRLGPIDPDATHVRAPSAEWVDVVFDDLAPITDDEDVVTERVSFSMPLHPSMGGGGRTSARLRAAAPVHDRAPSVRTMTAAPPSAQLRADEARRQRDRLSASFTSTPSGKKTLCAPPIDLDGDQTLDPPARVSPPMRVVESLMPARVSFPPPHYDPATSPKLLSDDLEPALRDTARRPLAPPILTQIPSYLRPHAPSSMTPLAAPASSPVAAPTSRASTFLLVAMLALGIGTTAVMGTATFAPGTLARGRTLVSEHVGFAHAAPEEARAVPVTYEPATAVPPVLGETSSDAGL